MARHSQSVVSFKLLLILAVLELWLTVPECGAVQVEISKPGRSSIWDREMHRERERMKRDTQCIMQTEKPCTLPDVTRFDTLGRRNSGLLVDVQDQGMCGSCWAFAASHGFSDLRGLSSGRKGELLSPEYATRCVIPLTGIGNGCCGGSAAKAARHFMETGMVTNQCLPYGLTRYQRNPMYKTNNPLMCSSTCQDNSPLNPANIKLVAYRYHKVVDDNTIINHLQSGPVVVSMLVPKSLFQYGCGIYCSEVVYTMEECTSSKGHSVEIVDYGTSDTGVDFWVFKNSWGSHKGEDGYYRIRRGDACIGKRGAVFLYTSPPGNSQGTVNIDTAVPSCSAEEVSDPNDSVYSESAAEYGINELARLRLIPCPDGSNATNITRRSISDATVQIISGAMVNLTLSANLVGCEAGTASVTIEMLVFIDTDGNFTLSGYEFSRNSPDGASIVGYSPIMIFIAFLLLFGLFAIG